MKAIVFHDVGDIHLDDVPEPRIETDGDAIVRVTASAICGTDLHMIRGSMPGMQPGTILGHEAVGIVEECGRGVRNLRKGDRVVIPSTIACGACAFCRAGEFSQCDGANPNGARAGTAFYGGPKETGPYAGLQAEYARIPYAHTGAVKVPDEVSDDQAVLISDIFPTAWFGAELARIDPGDTVAVFGCGPVGQLAILSAQLMGAGRVLAVDTVPTRLEAARTQGAETIDFNEEHPVDTILELTSHIGVDRAIDAVGVDAFHPHRGPAAREADERRARYEREVRRVAPRASPHNGNWHPGDAPSQALEWAAHSLAKAGTLAIIGVYPERHRTFPIGLVMNRNLTVRAGNCPHRRYVPRLLELVRTGAADPAGLVTQRQPLSAAIDAYRAFDQRQSHWLKVELQPGG